MRNIRARFIVGSDGRKEAVLLGMAEYHRLMGKLEDLQDALALDRAERTSKKLIPYSSVQKRLKRGRQAVSYRILVDSRAAKEL